MLHGIPILLKDSIATKDMLNSTTGSFALLGLIVPRDAGVVTKSREAGTIKLGKASMSEWSNFRSTNFHNGWCGRAGQGKVQINNTPIIRVLLNKKFYKKNEKSY